MDKETRDVVNNSFREIAAIVRESIETTKGTVKDLLKHPALMGPAIPLAGDNIPETMQANMAANITLAFRALEDARMRVGKAMQANQGGISIFDKEKKETPATQEELDGGEGKSEEEGSGKDVGEATGNEADA